MAQLPPDAPVELVHWPRDAARREALARGGVSCLLLVARGAQLPDAVATTEDWVRLPADERDVVVRARSLCRRLARAAAELPIVEDGFVLHAGHRAQLSEAEAAAMQCLLEAAGSVVSREALSAAVWPAGPPSERSLDALLNRLRQRTSALNIHLRAERGRGYAVDVGPVAADAPVAP
jgi:DNA-binding response OmpR family regulator